MTSIKNDKKKIPHLAMTAPDGGPSTIDQLAGGANIVLTQPMSTENVRPDRILTIPMIAISGLTWTPPADNKGKGGRIAHQPRNTASMKTTC
ncbi:hypothetical protein DESC_150057 [Desulfosarcina cetonica]|nr:hypothetical protein DESC_150057 [Desulfosarcina cetonica]